jgi:hypothetical protein
VPWTRTTAASPPDFCSVSPPTCESYCSKIHLREARSGQPISFSRSAAMSALSHIAQRRGLGRGDMRAVIERRVVGQRVERNVADHLAVEFQHHMAGVGHFADDGKSSSHFLKIASAIGSLPGWSTMSMRSWLSDSIIS